MKKRIVLELLFLMVGMATMAVPAFPVQKTIQTVDGEELHIFKAGDECYSYWEDEEGRQVDQKANGDWIVLDEATRMARRTIRRASQLSDRPRYNIGPVNLAPKGLVILVNFSDVAFSAENDIEGMREMLNGDNYTYDGATGSARQYFIDQSNGAYKPQFDVIGPVTLDKPRAYYGATSGNSTDIRPAQFAVDACQKADLLGVDFSQYDSDGDGSVDFVFMIFADKGEADGGPAEAIWPHNWYVKTSAHITCQLDGKYIDNYACAAEKNGQTGARTGIGTFCHEFSHVIGMPDYYDTKSGTNYANRMTPKWWSIMDVGSYNNSSKTPPNYSIFDKYFMGWQTPEVLGAAEKKLTLVENGKTGFVGYQISSKETLQPARTAGVVYYVESRERTGWDLKLPSHGLVIWKVNFNQSAWTTNTPNNTAYQPRYTLVSASGSTTGLGTGDDAYPGRLEVHEKKVMEGREFNSIEEVNKVVSFHYNRQSETINLQADTFATLDKTKQTTDAYLQVSGTAKDDNGTNYNVQIRVKTSQYAKTYAAADFDMNATQLVQNAETLSIGSVSGKVLAVSSGIYYIEATMVKDRFTSYSVRGYFKVEVPVLKQYEVSVSTSHYGSVTLNATNYMAMTNVGTYVDGTRVTLMPTPNTGCHFVGWDGTDKNAVRNNNGSYQLQVTGKNYLLDALFERMQYAVNVSSSEVTRGTVEMQSDGKNLSNGSMLYYGEEIVLTAQPAENCYFTQWSDGNKTNPRTWTVKAATNLTAQFAEIVKEKVTVKGYAADSTQGEVTMTVGGKNWVNGDKVEVGTEVEWTAISKEYYHFARWNDGNTDNPRRVTVYTPTEYVAVYEKEYLTFSMQQPSHGSVLMTADGYVPSTDSNRYEYLTKVRLTPYPETGYEFTQWTGNDASRVQKEEDGYYLILSKRQYDLSALFSKQQFAVTAHAEHGEVEIQTSGGVVQSGSSVEYGTEITLSVTPDLHYHFVGWSDGGTDNPRHLVVKNTVTQEAMTEEDGVDTLRINMTEPMTVVDKTTDKGNPYLQLSGQATDGNGNNCSVEWKIPTAQYTGQYDAKDIDNESTHIYMGGQPMDITSLHLQILQKDLGLYQVEAWLNKDKYTTYHFRGEFEVVIPEPTRYLVETLASDSGVIVLKATDYVDRRDSGRYVSGTEVELVPQPATGYIFSHWVGSDASRITQRDGRYWLQITDTDYQVGAVYRKIQYTLTALTDNQQGQILLISGTDTLHSGEEIEHGSLIHVEAISNPHYHFVKWTDGVTDSLREETIVRDMTYQAEFARDSVKVTILPDAHGSVSLLTSKEVIANGEGLFEVGTEVIIVATPAVGYRFASWTGEQANQVQKVGNDYRLIVQDYAYQIGAAFEKLTYTVNASSAESAMGKVLLRQGNDTLESGSQVPYGDEVELSAIADDFFRFVAWSDGCLESNRTVLVTENVTLTARFEEIAKKVSILCQEGGKVTLQATGYAETENAGEYMEKTVVRLTPVAEEGYQFSQWKGADAASVAKKNQRYELTIARKNYDIEAVFAKKRFVVRGSSRQTDKGEVLLTAEGHIVSNGDSLEYGTALSVTAIAEPDHHFVAWTDGMTDNPRTITVTGEVNLKADFAHDVLPIIDLWDNKAEGYYDTLNNYADFEVATIVLHRSFSENMWSTICLPFDVNDLSMTELSGCVYKFISASGDADKGLSLNFTATNQMEANIPYILVLNKAIVDPFFTNVVLRKQEDKYVHGGDVDFVANMRPTLIKGVGKSVLGFSNNKLYYPNLESGVNMKAYRAYFKVLSASAGAPDRVCVYTDGIQMDEEDMMDNMDNVQKIFCEGELIIRKNGSHYNVLGGRIAE